MIEFCILKMSSSPNTVNVPIVSTYRTFKSYCCWINCILMVLLLSWVKVSRATIPASPADRTVRSKAAAEYTSFFMLLSHSSTLFKMGVIICNTSAERFRVPSATSWVNCRRVGVRSETTTHKKTNVLTNTYYNTNIWKCTCIISIETQNGLLASKSLGTQTRAVSVLDLNLTGTLREGFKPVLFSLKENNTPQKLTTFLVKKTKQIFSFQSVWNDVKKQNKLIRTKSRRTVTTSPRCFKKAICKAVVLLKGVGTCVKML